MPKEKLENDILAMTSGKTNEVCQFLFEDEEIGYLQEYSNIVSTRRIFLNDHGPVHMRFVMWYSLQIMNILKQNKIETSLTEQNLGTYEDSEIVIATSAFLHDVGMSISRPKHEYTGVHIALPIVERILQKFYPNDLRKCVIMRSMIIEAIVGHMATMKIFSVEAGVILVADGCDMEKGRARAPRRYQKEPKVGDIHQYSSAAVEEVTIGPGEKKPIRITVDMRSNVGFFQVEEVMMPKIDYSPIKKHIEVFAGVLKDGDENDHKQYL